MLIDTHCHLDFSSFDQDRVEVIHRACDHGVKWLINPGINLESSRKAISLTEQFPEVLAAVGVHPNEALTWDDATLDELERLAVHPRVVAIGEIGLDYYRDYSPRDRQVHIFKEQLRLAARSGLPVIIHNRQATEDLFVILADWRSYVVETSPKLIERPGVLHSFSDDEQAAQKAVEMGYYLGIGGPITYPRAARLRSVVTSLDITKILLETDSPFLPPHPYRGKRNEPVNITMIAEKISEIRIESLDTISRQACLNARNLFQW